MIIVLLIAFLVVILIFAGVFLQSKGHRNRLDRAKEQFQAGKHSLAWAVMNAIPMLHAQPIGVHVGHQRLLDRRLCRLRVLRSMAFEHFSGKGGKRDEVYSGYRGCPVAE